MTNLDSAAIKMKLPPPDARDHMSPAQLVTEMIASIPYDQRRDFLTRNGWRYYGYSAAYQCSFYANQDMIDASDCPTFTQIEAMTITARMLLHLTGIAPIDFRDLNWWKTARHERMHIAHESY